MSAPETPTFEALLNLDFHWPTLGDSLFKTAPPGKGSELSDDGFQRLVLMATGYREAGDILVRQAEENYFHRDTLIYPIVFLYRHYIELQLKYILFMYGKRAKQEADWVHHDLDVLWPKVRRVIEHFNRKPSLKNAEALNAVETCVAEFAKIDPKSFSFRYPVTKQGQPLTLPFASVDLSNLKHVMTNLDAFFIGVDGQLDDYMTMEDTGDAEPDDSDSEPDNYYR